MSEHTPIPWYCEKDRRHFSGDHQGVSICQMGGRIIAVVQFLYMDGSDEEWANVEHIVRACNAHNDLLAACKAFVDSEESKPGSCTIRRAYEICRVAVAKVTPDPEVK